MVYERGTDGDFDKPLFNVVSGAMYAEWRKEDRSFSDLALVGYNGTNLSGGGGQLPEQVHSATCTWNLLRTLGVHPALGRDFTATDDQPSANGVVLLSWSLWKRRFGGAPSILNQTVHLDGKPYTVVGVLPAWFAFPSASTQLWTPVYHDNPPNELTSLGNHSFRVVGRLREGITSAQAVADLSLISKRVHDEHLDNAFVGMAANARPLL
jgi:putative ABC transport system permease protein